MPKNTKSCTRCGQEIYFDPNQKSSNGKWIPIDAMTNKPHDCPNSTFKTQKTIGDEIIDLDQRESERIKRIQYD
jgi:hypothetical protein